MWFAENLQKLAVLCRIIIEAIALSSYWEGQLGLFVCFLYKRVQNYFLCCPEVLCGSWSISQRSDLFSQVTTAVTYYADIHLSVTTHSQTEPWWIVIKSGNIFPYNYTHRLNELLFKLIPVFKFRPFDWKKILRRNSLFGSFFTLNIPFLNFITSLFQALCRHSQAQKQSLSKRSHPNTSMVGNNLCCRQQK